MMDDTERLEKKITGVEEKIDEIRDNHLPHIYERLGALSGAQRVLLGLSIATFVTVVGTIVKVTLFP